MLTGELRSKVDALWNAFWSGGIANPIEVIEQITYLLFLRRLDDLHTVEERKAQRLGKPIERRIYPEGSDERGRAYEDMRWSRFKNFEATEMFKVVGEHVFPFLRSLGGPVAAPPPLSAGRPDPCRRANAAAGISRPSRPESPLLSRRPAP